MYPLDVYVFNEVVASSRDEPDFFLLTQRQDPHSGRDEDKQFEAADGDVPLAPCNLEGGWHLGAV